MRRCCNHPFLFEAAEEEFRGKEGDGSAVDRLIVTSGKMVLLDKLLKRLKQTGHRCGPLGLQPRQHHDICLPEEFAQPSGTQAALDSLNVKGNRTWPAQTIGYVM